MDAFVRRVVVSTALAVLLAGCSKEPTHTVGGGDSGGEADMAATPDMGGSGGDAGNNTTSDLGGMDMAGVDMAATDMAGVDMAGVDMATTDTGGLDAATDMGGGAYTLSVTVSGLLGGSVTLQNNGADDLVAGSDGTSTFATGLSDGAGYDVTVSVHPMGPAQYCVVDNGSGTVVGADVVDVLVRCSTTALYPANGGDWNHYVADDGATASSASDTVCDAAAGGIGCEACLHGGELRRFEIVGQTCAGLTITDALGAFDWACDDSSGTTWAWSTNLKDTAKLADLLDSTAASWRPNSITVNDGATDVYTTSPTVWWDNPVVDASAGVNGGTDSTIYVVGSDSTGSWLFDSVDHVALVVADGATLSGTGTGNLVWFMNVVHPWFEGAVDATGMDAGVTYDFARCGVLSDASAANARTGFYLLNGANSNRLQRLTADGNSDDGVYLNGSPSNRLLDELVENVDITGVGGTSRGMNIEDTDRAVVRDVSITDGGKYGLLADLVDDLELERITATNTTEYGVYVGRSMRPIGSDLTATDSGQCGLAFFGPEDGVFTNLSATSVKPNGTGIGIFGGTGSRFSNLTARGNQQHGVQLGGATGLSATTVSNIVATSNGAYGVWVEDSGANSITLVNVLAADNGYSGVSIMGDGTVASNVRSFANADYGFEVLGPNTVIAGALAIGNRTFGVRYGAVGANVAHASVLMDATAAHAPDRNVAVYSGEHTLLNVASANANLGIGIGQDEDGLGFNLAAANNSSYEVALYSNTTFDFGGVLLTGTAQCNVIGGGIGLTHITCVPSGPSTATLTAGVDLSAAFVGPVTSDSMNGSAVGGTALAENITDWSTFENTRRTWAKGEAGGYVAANRGRCNTAGTTCQIWDWRLRNTDALLRDRAALPTGNDVVIHDWYQAVAPASQADCAPFPGSSYDAVDGVCRTTFLRSAVEVMEDGIGNDNALCESNETCVYSPNIGAYQGEGTLVSAGAFTDGTIIGVTLMEWDTNGAP